MTESSLPGPGESCVHTCGEGHPWKRFKEKERRSGNSKKKVTMDRGENKSPRLPSCVSCPCGVGPVWDEQIIF